jgi:hypothetical protein
VGSLLGERALLYLRGGRAQGVKELQAAAGRPVSPIVGVQGLTGTIAQASLALAMWRPLRPSSCP